MASIPLTTTTYIPSDSWECLNTCNEWHNIILQALGKANPYCSFAFKNKWQKKEGSRKSSSVCFRCTGSCTFADCPVRFKVEVMSFVKSDSPQQLKTSVHFSSKYVKHDKTERRSRWIRSVDCQHIATELKYQSASTLYNSKFAKLTTAALESGQRDGTGGSPEVIRKISSEAKRKEFPHYDLITSLCINREETRESEFSKFTVPGYMQHICAVPFSVLLYTEQGVRTYHHMGTTSTLFCNATGSIVSLKGTQYKSDTVLYYSPVLSHPHSDCPPVAVAELISTEHSALAISHFLECFRKSEGLIYGYKHVIIPSLILLLSFLHVYISHYLHRCFRIVNGCCTDKADYDKLFIQACVVFNVTQLS